jgi:hypothetical protein
LNDVPALVFDGVDDVLTMSAGALSVFQNVWQGRVMAVGLTDAAGDSGHYVAFFGTGTGALTAVRIGFLSRLSSVATVTAIQRRTDADSGVVAGSVGVTTSAFLGEAVANWTGNAATGACNGVVGTPVAYSSGGGVTSNTPSQSALIGWNNAAGANRLDGTVAAVVATNQAWSTALANLVRLVVSKPWKIRLDA